MSKKVLRGGSIYIDEKGNAKRVRPPTKMAASGAKESPQKSKDKPSNKGEE